MGGRDGQGAMRPILLPLHSVNHSCPSSPTAILCGLLSAVGTGHLATSPSGLIRPISFRVLSVNQRLPSGPAAHPC
jgi:hypothetical protein